MGSQMPFLLSSPLDGFASIVPSLFSQSITCPECLGFFSPNVFVATTDQIISYILNGCKSEIWGRRHA